MYHIRTQMSNLVALHYCEFRDLAVIPLMRNVEFCLDNAGYVPYLHPISGGIRMAIVGPAELVMAVALAAFFAFAGQFKKSSERKVFKAISLDLLRFAVHGVANVGRGYAECFRWYNLIWILHDQVTKDEKDALRLHYERPIFGLPVFKA